MFAARDFLTDFTFHFIVMIRGPGPNGTVEMLLTRGLGLGVTVVCFYDRAKLGIGIDYLPVLG